MHCSLSFCLPNGKRCFWDCLLQLCNILFMLPSFNVIKESMKLFSPTSLKDRLSYIEHFQVFLSLERRGRVRKGSSSIVFLMGFFFLLSSTLKNWLSLGPVPNVIAIGAITLCISLYTSQSNCLPCPPLMTLKSNMKLKSKSMSLAMPKKPLNGVTISINYPRLYY